MVQAKQDSRVTVTGRKRTGVTCKGSHIGLQERQHFLRPELHAVWTLWWQLGTGSGFDQLHQPLHSTLSANCIAPIRGSLRQYDEAEAAAILQWCIRVFVVDKYEEHML